MDEVRGGELSVQLLLDFLSLCESSGFIQLQLPFAELKEKLVDLWAEIFSPSSAENAVSTASQDGCLTVSPAKPADEVSENAAAEVDSGTEEEEDGREMGRDEEDMNWSLLTPDLSRVSEDGEQQEESGSVGDDGEREEESGSVGDDGEREEKSGSMGEDEEREKESGSVGEDGEREEESGSMGEDEEREEESGSMGEDEEREEESGSMGEDGVEEEAEMGIILAVQVSDSPGSTLEFSCTPVTETTPPHCLALAQPDLSTASSSEEDVSSPASDFDPTPSPASSPTADFDHTPSPASPAADFDHTPSSAPSGARSPVCLPTSTPSPPRDSPITYPCSSAVAVKREPREIDRGSPIPPPSSQSPPCPVVLGRDKSSAIQLDSSDDEDDTKLENLFSSMRLKKKSPKHIPSRKSLEVFIVSEESDGEDCSEVVPRGTSSNLQTPLDPPFHRKAPLVPLTPYTAAVWWGSPGENLPEPPKQSSHHCLTAPPRQTNRQPLSERNHTPGIPSKTSGSNPPLTTPSAHKTFSRHKKDTARELYSLFNGTVFDNQLPGDMELSWNSKLRTTAGYCRNMGTLYNRQSRIELSTKVIDSFDRLRDTIVHEMCHAAVWVINGVKNGGHGRHWQAWALKANTVHPDLSTITRCHSYDISYKYSYKCIRCDYKLGRHSKSVNLTTARCPFCLGRLEFEPRLNADGTPASVKLNRYAQFVKEHYAEVKQNTPQGGHKAVMQRLRDQYYSSSSRTPVPHLDGSFSS